MAHHVNTVVCKFLLNNICLANYLIPWPFLNHRSNAQPQVDKTGTLTTGRAVVGSRIEYASWLSMENVTQEESKAWKKLSVRHCKLCAWYLTFMPLSTPPVAIFTTFSLRSFSSSILLFFRCSGERTPWGSLSLVADVHNDRRTNLPVFVSIRLQQQLTNRGLWKWLGIEIKWLTCGELSRWA